jgi:hypothetical protein
VNKLFIAKERKVTTVDGTGIQYIPGHIEPLVDMVIENNLPVSGQILDLGGGGLRFAIPVAEKNKKITVVDLDSSGLDINIIYNKMIENNIEDLPDLELITQNIIIKVDNVFNFLKNTNTIFSLITSFRLIHFFSEKDVVELFKLISKKISDHSKLIISAITPFNEDNITYNDIYLNSKPVSKNIYYRKFMTNELANKIQTEQNLGDYIHLFTADYIESYANKFNFKLIESNLPSTKIVRGFIFSNE